MTERTLAGLAAQIRREGGLLATALIETPRVPRGDPGLGALAASSNVSEIVGGALAARK